MNRRVVARGSTAAVAGVLISLIAVAMLRSGREHQRAYGDYQRCLAESQQQVCVLLAGNSATHSASEFRANYENQLLLGTGGLVLGILLGIGGLVLALWSRSQPAPARPTARRARQRSTPTAATTPTVSVAAKPAPIRRDMQRASLAGRDLRGAGLRQVSLWGADLRAADLRGADLTDSDLRMADLRGADLRDARLTWAWEEWPMDPEIEDRTLWALEGAIVDDDTRWPAGFIGVLNTRAVYGGPDSITIGNITIPCLTTTPADQPGAPQSVTRIHHKSARSVLSTVDGSPYGLTIPREALMRARPDLIKGQVAEHAGRAWTVAALDSAPRALLVGRPSGEMGFAVVGVTGPDPAVTLDDGESTTTVSLGELLPANLDRWWWHVNVEPPDHRR